MARRDARGGEEKGRKQDIDIEHTLRYTKDKHIVLYDYNTIVMKHFISKETKKNYTHSFP